MGLDHISPLSSDKDSLSPIPTEFVCMQVKSTLDLIGKTQGILLFEGKKKGWGVDHKIKINYKIRIKSRGNWQDKTSFDDIEITDIRFEGNYAERMLGISAEDDLCAEIYLREMGINISDEIRKAYYGEE